MDTSLNDSQLSLDDKIQQMSLQIDTLRSSRNYYKDQCESLLISLSNTVHDQTPAYRTQKEVEEMIENIKKQSSEKNKLYKQRYLEKELRYKNEISNLQAKIESQEVLLDKQAKARTDLIEQMMGYKRQLSASLTKQRDTERTLDELRSSQSSFLSQQQLSEENSREFENREAAHASEVKRLKKHLLKTAKQLDDAKASSTLAQQICEETIKENNTIKEQHEALNIKFNILQKEYNKQSQDLADSRSLLRNAITEAGCLQSDIESAQETILQLTKRLTDKETSFNEMHEQLVNKIIEINSYKSTINIGNEKQTKLLTEHQELIQKYTQIQNQIKVEESKLLENESKNKLEISKLNSSIQNYESQIDALSKKLQQTQTELLQETRLRKAAEVAKEAAITNLKNAYALLNNSEVTRSDFNVEIEKLTAEVEEKTSKLKESEASNEALKAKIADLNKQLSAADSAHKELQSQYDSVNQKYERMVAHSILKEEARKLIDAVKQERDSLKQHSTELETANHNAVVELSDLRTAFVHQEDTIASLQGEVKTLTRINKKLRSKFLHGEQADSELLKPTKSVSNIPTITSNASCAKCNESKKATEAAEKKVAAAQKEINQLKKEIENSKVALRELLKKAKDIVGLAPEMSAALDATIRALDADRPVEDMIKISEQFLLDFFDAAVAAKSTDPSVEAKLLRSSLAHLQARVADLKEKEADQENELARLRNTIQGSYATKEKCETEMQAMAQNVNSLRTSLDATKVKLVEVEREKRKLKEELILAKIDTVQGVEAKSNITHSDSFSISEISSLDNDILKTTAKSVPTANALGDSLAMLDIICQ